MIKILIQRLEQAKAGFLLHTRRTEGSVYCAFWNGIEHKEAFERRYNTVTLEEKMSKLIRLGTLKELKDD